MTLKISSWLNDCTETPCVSTATHTLQVCMYLQINVHAHYTSFHTTLCTNGQCILGCRLACMNCRICWNRTSLTLTMWQCVAMKCCTKVDPCGAYSHYPHNQMQVHTVMDKGILFIVYLCHLLINARGMWLCTCSCMCACVLPCTCAAAVHAPPPSFLPPLLRTLQSGRSVCMIEMLLVTLPSSPPSVSTPLRCWVGQDEDKP